MDHFFEVDRYLTGKRKGACGDFWQLVKAEFAGLDNQDQGLNRDSGYLREYFYKLEVEKLFSYAHEKVKLQFADECNFLRECRPDFSVMISLIEPRQEKKIDDFVGYKLKLVRYKSRSDESELNGLAILKTDFEKLLSKNELVINN